jgi:hypothetical protein
MQKNIYFSYSFYHKVINMVLFPFAGKRSACAAPALLTLVLAATPFTTAVAAGLKKLSLDECASLAQSPFKPALSSEWKAYLAYTKVCPLRKTRTSKAAVVLVSVFIDDYYKANPGQKEWKQFPLPLLISADDKCLARLPEHFPFEQPVDLTLNFGHWHKDIPTQITVDVSNPSVGGDYQLPKLFWSAKEHRYFARKDTDRHTAKATDCPI